MEVLNDGYRVSTSLFIKRFKCCYDYSYDYVANNTYVDIYYIDNRQKPLRLSVNDDICL